MSTTFSLLYPIQIWAKIIRRDDPKDEFEVSEHTKVCSAHFVDSDFINEFSSKRRLHVDAIPSVFAWSKQVVPRPFIEKKRRLEEEREQALAEETETASEGEGFWEKTAQEDFVSRGTQADIELYRVRTDFRSRL